MKKQEHISLKKSVKHTFTAEEVATLNTEFRQAFANLKSVEAEFDSVKASYKAKTTEAESRMETLNAILQAGFEMRVEDCIVIFRPSAKKKDFFLQMDLVEGELAQNVTPCATEDMTQEDFEQDLIRAESTFDKRVEIVLWDAGDDHGMMIVGTQLGRWFAAVRGNVGARKLEERLDNEQRSTKKRFDAIGQAAKRVQDWLKANLGKDAAKGFDEVIAKVLEDEKDKVE